MAAVERHLIGTIHRDLVCMVEPGSECALYMYESDLEHINLWSGAIFLSSELVLYMACLCGRYRSQIFVTAEGDHPVKESPGNFLLR